MKKVIMVILLLTVFNLHSQEQFKNKSHLKLTALSEKIIEMFIADSMNKHRIDPSSCSLVLSFGDIHDSSNELWIMDNELLNSCCKDTYVTKYKDFNIFYNGILLSKYIQKYSDVTEIRCVECDSILKTWPIGEEIVFMNYDGSIYKIKKGTTIKNIKFERVKGG